MTDADATPPYRAGTFADRYQLDAQGRVWRDGRVTLDLERLTDAHGHRVTGAGSHLVLVDADGGRVQLRPRTLRDPIVADALDAAFDRTGVRVHDLGTLTVPTRWTGSAPVAPRPPTQASRTSAAAPERDGAVRARCSAARRARALIAIAAAVVGVPVLATALVIVATMTGGPGWVWTAALIGAPVVIVAVVVVAVRELVAARLEIDGDGLLVVREAIGTRRFDLRHLAELHAIEHFRLDARDLRATLTADDGARLEVQPLRWSPGVGPALLQWARRQDAAVTVTAEQLLSGE